MEKLLKKTHKELLEQSQKECVNSLEIGTWKNLKEFLKELLKETLEEFYNKKLSQSQQELLEELKEGVGTPNYLVEINYRWN